MFLLAMQSYPRKQTHFTLFCSIYKMTLKWPLIYSDHSSTKEPQLTRYTYSLNLVKRIRVRLCEIEDDLA